MSLSRLRQRAARSASSAFIDRETLISLFNARWRTYSDNANSLRVLMYYGMGGIGKTALIRHLSSEMDALDGVVSFYVDLESPLYNNQTDCLLDMRRHIPTQCSLFDYAVARLYLITGKSLSAIHKGWLSPDSLLLDFQALAADLAETVAPARLLIRLFDRVDELRRRYLTSLKPHFLAIDRLKDEELETQLPYYLCLELASFLRRKELRLVIFFDSHESVVNRPGFRSTKRRGDQWLQDFIGCLEMGLFVIAGRDSLLWSDENPDWCPYLEQHAVGPLSKYDAEHFLTKVPIPEPEIRSTIVESAKGVPFYLDVCADTYLLRKEHGARLTPADFRGPKLELIRRFLAHLHESHQEMLRATAAVSYFDIVLFRKIAESLNIHFPVSLFELFCSMSHTEPAIASGDFFRIREPIKHFLHDQLDPKSITLVYEAVLSYCEQCIAERRLSCMIWPYRDLITFCGSGRMTMTPQQVDAVIGAGLYLIDRDHWLPVAASFDALDKDMLEASPAAPQKMLYFIGGLCQRKKGNLCIADSFYQKARNIDYNLGRFHWALEFHYAHTLHLLGHYAAARERYTDIVSQVGEEGRTDIAHMVSRQLGDVLLLDGKFAEALAVFNHIVREWPQEDLWQAENYRFVGHVYRFNLEFTSAEHYYYKAYNIASGHCAEAMMGKALTNLAETLCWGAPATARNYADRAVELNRNVEALIEVGKALSAKCIACVMDNHLEAANAAGTQALAIQGHTGYKAGQLMALQALAIYEQVMHREERVNDLICQMQQIVHEITVYKYLLIIPISLVGGKVEQSLMNQCSWLWPDRITNRISDIVEHVRHARKA
jgi:tetratricopeptide (TPR) repeat protein